MILHEEPIMVINRIHLGNVVLARNLAASATVREIPPTAYRAGKPPGSRRSWLRRVLRIRLHPMI